MTKPRCAFILRVPLRALFPHSRVGPAPPLPGSEQPGKVGDKAVPALVVAAMMAPLQRHWSFHVCGNKTLKDKRGGTASLVRGWRECPGEPGHEAGWDFPNELMIKSWLTGARPFWVPGRGVPQAPEMGYPPPCRLGSWGSKRVGSACGYRARREGSPDSDPVPQAPHHSARPCVCSGVPGPEEASSPSR